MRLYHYTAARFLRGIGRYGLTIGDVPTDLRRNRGRVGIWFTSSPMATGHGLAGAGVDKGRYRLSVEFDDDDPGLIRWLDWAPDHVTPETVSNLVDCAGKDGTAQPETWFVHFAPVPAARIALCEDMWTRAPIVGWPDHIPPGESDPGVPAWRRHAHQRQLMKKCARHLRTMADNGHVITF